MSVRIMTQIWASGPDDPRQRLVLLAIADHADDQGRAYPSMIGIAQKCALSERGARGIVRKLEAAGWLDTKIGGGRGGKSHYTVNPAPETRNEKPGMRNPECGAPETRNGTTLNPERGAPEPSRTIKEPSISNNAREIRGALLQWASPDSVDSFIAYRRKQKGNALSLTAAKRLANSLKAIFDAEGKPSDALGMAEEHGWKTVKPEWYFKRVRNNGYGGFSSGQGARDPRDDPQLRAIARAAGAFETPGSDST